MGGGVGWWAWQDVVVSADPKAVYYDAGGIETIEVIRAKLGPDLFVGVLPWKHHQVRLPVGV